MFRQVAIPMVVEVIEDKSKRKRMCVSAFFFYIIGKFSEFPNKKRLADGTSRLNILYNAI